MGSEILQGEIRLLKPEDVERAYVLETEGYPEDEAATYDGLVYRQREAPDLFLGFFEGFQLKGFICGTRYTGPYMQEEAMKKHLPQSECVCIHSVCVDRKSRHKGIASRLLAAYTKHVKGLSPLAVKIVLICKASLIPLYTRAGYQFVKKSSIVHGKDAWYDMELPLTPL